jgi:hypothetical protein
LQFVGKEQTYADLRPLIFVGGQDHIGFDLWLIKDKGEVYTAPTLGLFVLIGLFITVT